MNKINDFMLQLLKELVDKKQVTESTATLYIKNLYTLNNKQPFINLSFLKNTDSVDQILNEYSDNTKKTFLSGITSVLSLFKDKVSYKKIYKHYYDKMMTKATEMKDTNINVMSNTQKDNWMKWEDIIIKKEDLKKLIEEFKNQKLITNKQFEILLSYVILCLYTEIPPRRNQDYMDMYVVSNLKESGDKSKNYLDWTNKNLIFNHYKTSKKYGTQQININESKDLIDALTLYLKFHPLAPKKDKMPKNTEFKFLTNYDGSGFTSVNAITRILNKIFGGKKIGSSMLRHIYLSSKYDIDEMKKDAEDMGHSLGEQKNYMKSNVV